MKGYWSVSNKAKTSVSRKQSRPNFPKNEHLLPLDTQHVRVHIREWEMFVFRKIWRALFSWNTGFEIRPFALLPMILYNSWFSTLKLLKNFSLKLLSKLFSRNCVYPENLPFSLFYVNWWKRNERILRKWEN